MKYHFGIKINIILLLVFLLYFSTFLFLPYFAIFLNAKSLPIILISAVMTTIMVFQQGMTLFTGIAGDVYGYAKLIYIGVILRIASFIILFLSDHSLLILLASALLGFGTACTIPNIKSTLIVLGEEKQNKIELLAARNIVLNVSVSLGPLVGALLFEINYKWVISLILAIHFFILLLLFFIVNSVKNETQNKNFNFKNIFSIFNNKNLVKILLLSIPFFMMFNQVTFILPIYINDVLKDSTFIGILFTINAIFVIFFQAPILKKMLSYQTEENTLIISMLIISIAFLLLAVSYNYLLFTLFIILFSLSEILYTPILDKISSDYADKNNLSASFGLITLGSAIGGILGNQVVSILYTHWGEASAFIALAFIALCSLIYYPKKLKSK